MIPLVVGALLLVSGLFNPLLKQLGLPMLAVAGVVGLAIFSPFIRGLLIIGAGVWVAGMVVR
jgi:hypothetical protein